MVATTTTANASPSSITTHLKTSTVAILTAIKSAFLWTFTTLKASGVWIWQLISTTTLTILKGIATAARWIWSKLCAAWTWIIQKLRKWWFGEPVEVPKVIIRRHPRWYGRAWRGLSQCKVHMLPLAATITVVGLNWGTYFIGVDLPGWDTGQWQDFYRLALQVAAKLYELLIVASLATVIMDTLRYYLVFSQTGLPFGIITAKVRFVDAMYLFSPDFRWGIWGMSGMAKLWFGLLIAFCTGLSLFAGPSAALLLIPQQYTDWHAGGATYHVVGTPETLWPSTLNSDFTGGDRCQSPSSDLLSDPIDHSSCLWAGHQSLIHSWQRFNMPEITSREGGMLRIMDVQYYTFSAAAFGVSLASCTAGDLLSSLWRDAILVVKMSVFNKGSRLRFRQRGGSVAKVESEVPVVRVTCVTNDTGGLETRPDDIPFYPVNFEYPSDYDNGEPLEGAKYDIHDVWMYQYDFTSVPNINSSRLASTWIETPKNGSIGTRIANGAIQGYSSAYLNIQVPYPNGTGHNEALCAVDARWVKDIIQSTDVGLWGGIPTYRPQTLRVPDPIVFPALSNGDWRPVRLTMDWLQALTPTLGNESHWNTLSSLLASSDIVNATENEAKIAVIVASTIADGMSRIGYQSNGGEPGLPYLGITGEPSYKPILEGSYEVPLAPEVTAPESQRHKLRWDIYVTGQGYKLSSTSYGLAAAVLLTHVVIALGHIIWIIWIYTWRTGETSQSWGSLSDLLALAFQSTPPTSALENTSAGISRCRTFKERVRVRERVGAIATAGSSGGSSQNSTSQMVSHGVEMVMDSQLPSGGHQDLEKEKLY